MAFVYLAVWSDGSSYVGQTTNGLGRLEERYKSYTKEPCWQPKRSKQVNHRNRPSQLACRLHGMPLLGVLEYCPKDKLDLREQFWIGVHARDGKNLNITHSPNRVYKVGV